MKKYILAKNIVPQVQRYEKYQIYTSLRHYVFAAIACEGSGGFSCILKSMFYNI